MRRMRSEYFRVGATGENNAFEGVFEMDFDQPKRDDLDAEVDTPSTMDTVVREREFKENRLVAFLVHHLHLMT